MSAAFLTCELCHGHGYEHTEDGKEECSACNPDGETLREHGRDEMSEKEMTIERGRVYRGRRPAPVNGFVNDRQVLHVGLDTVQYDSPAIMNGGKYKVIGKEQFAAWAAKDVTDDLPKGEWQRWLDYKRPA